MAEKVQIRFDEDELTLGDLEDFEIAAGMPLADALKPKPVRDAEGALVRDETGRPEMSVDLSVKSLLALVWIVLRAERPGFTLDDARKVKVTTLEFVDNNPEDATPEGNDGGQHVESESHA